MTTYKTITHAAVEHLMPIEEACHSHPWTEKTFTSCIGGRYFGFYLIHNEEIVGFYIAEHVVGEVTLMDICVAPAKQGNGYGKQLLQHFLQETKNMEATKVWLEVRAKNISAQMLYINQGFTEVSRRTGYYPSASGFGYEDAIVMSLSV
jgi:[ribosomal protein S18]-alanine N-acetyltransferase